MQNGGCMPHRQAQGLAVQKPLGLPQAASMCSARRQAADYRGHECM
jgi:hypothetical protein